MRKIEKSAQGVYMIQPHMVREIPEYRSYLISDKIISQIYSFSLSEYEKFYCSSIQDASGDMVFYKNNVSNEEGILFIGPSRNQESNYVYFNGNCSYIGVRFKPGYPIIIDKTEASQLFNQVMYLKHNPLDFNYKSSSEGINFDSIMSIVHNYLSEPIDIKRELCCHIIDYMINYKDNLSRRDLEGYFGYTAYYMNKLFKDYTGYSLKKYYNLLKIHRLLNYYEKKSVDLKVPDYSTLALDFGYSDQAHMIREFQSYVGITPHKFWKQMYEIEVK